MKGAGLNLAERPTFYFIASNECRDMTPRFFLGDKEISYVTEKNGGDVYYLLAFSPRMLTETVRFEIGDKSGSFNLRAFYDFAVKANDTTLIHLVERLYRYSESVNAYFAKQS